MGFVKKILFCVIALCFSSLFNFIFAQSGDEGAGEQKILYTPQQQKLRITAENVRLIPDKDGGYHLYVKKLPNVNSILLTETTKDPAGKQDSYAYRATEYNSINGDEVRVLDGKKLESEGAKFSLVDSTPEETDFFGPAFHIFIPNTIVYGYEWSRHGSVTIGKGTFINIRSYAKPYADYSGDFMDSPFMFDLQKVKVAKPVETIETVLTDEYNPVAGETFKEMSENIIYSKGPETIISDICKLIDDFGNKDELDLVFAIDATGSMKNDLETLKADLIPALKNIFGENPKARIGLLFYRDYGDTFKYRDLPVKVYGFTSSFSSIEKNLNGIKIVGKEGGDVPEAVYEAMYAACDFYSWRPFGEKRVILIGDAEPHPSPRGTRKYSKEYVLKLAEEKGIKIHSILLPKN